MPHSYPLLYPQALHNVGDLDAVLAGGGLIAHPAATAEMVSQPTQQTRYNDFPPKVS